MKIKLNFYIDIGNSLKPTEVSTLMSDLNRQILNNLVLNSKVLGIEVLTTNKEIEAYMPKPTNCNECPGREDCEEAEDDTEEEEDGDVQYIDMSDISNEELLEELRSRLENVEEEDEE